VFCHSSFLKFCVCVCFIFLLYVILIYVKLNRALVGSLVDWMCVCAGLASVGTGFLWWTYYGEYKQRVDFNETMQTEEFSDPEFRIPLTNVYMQNETAFLILSIVASVLTVCCRLLTSVV